MGAAPGCGFFFTSMRFNEDPRAVFARLGLAQPPITEDYIMWAVLLPHVDLPANVGDLDADALHRLALDAARDYHPLLRRFVEDADTAYTVVTTLAAATRPTRWTASRVTLMGDAIHAMPPTGAHGGNTALRDAALLAGQLRDAAGTSAPLEQAIAAYQETMLEYAFKEVARSTAMLKRSSLTNPLLRFAMLRALPRLRALRGTPLVTQ
jgi:2-polyprenyl-6-methoxyphenol hydroxylase-like FAD-dependent oxidoreductase